MYKTHKYTLLLCLVLPSMFLLHGCATSTKSTVTASTQGTSLSSTKLVDSETGGGREGSTRPARSVSSSSKSWPVVAGSKTPGKWVYSKDKAVACRIKQWSSFLTPQVVNHIEYEFINLKSEKLTRIAYTILPKMKDGKVLQLFNEFTQKQSDIAELEVPLSKDQSKVHIFDTKNELSIHSIELTGCRIAKSTETRLTLNPQMRGLDRP
jgi:hypothetical protein